MIIIVKVFDHVVALLSKWCIEILIESSRAEGFSCLQFGKWSVPTTDFHKIIKIRLWTCCSWNPPQIRIPTNIRTALIILKYLVPSLPVRDNAHSRIQLILNLNNQILQKITISKRRINIPSTIASPNSQLKPIFIHDFKWECFIKILEMSLRRYISARLEKRSEGQACTFCIGDILETVV